MVRVLASTQVSGGAFHTGGYPQEQALPSLKQVVLPGAILIGAMIWRLIGITSTEVWRDEAVTLIRSKESYWDLLFHLPAAEDSPPLWFLLIKIWSIGSSNEIWLRLLPVLLGTAAVAVLMKAAYLLHRQSWWAAGALTAFSPVPVHYSQELRTYSLLFLLTAICFLIAEPMCGPRPTRRRALYLALCAGAAAHCHSVGVLIYPMLVGYVFVRGGAQSLRLLATSIAGALWLAFVIPVLWFSRHWVAYHHRVGDWWIQRPSWAASLLHVRDFLGLAEIRRWSAAGSVERMWSGYALEQILMIASIGLLAMALLNPRTRRAGRALLCAAVAYVGALAVASWVSQPAILDRTLLPAWAPVMLLLGLGAVPSSKRSIGFVGPLLAIAMSGALAVSWAVGSAGTVRRHESRAAFDWLRERYQRGDVIVSVPIWYEEMTVYALYDRLDGADLLCEAVRGYHGQPPRRILIAPEPDPLWLDRLDRLIEQRRLRGAKYTVWTVGIRVAHRQDLVERLEREHWPIAWYLPQDDHGTGVVGYTLKQGNARLTSAPALPK